MLIKADTVRTLSVLLCLAAHCGVHLKIRVLDQLVNFNCTHIISINLSDTEKAMANFCSNSKNIFIDESKSISLSV